MEYSTVYKRVNGANILICEPEEKTGSERLLVATMHGGLGRTLEHNFIMQLSREGFTTACCVPDKASFIDQFISMNNCMKYFRESGKYDKIVLMGQSRGAGLMSAYQKIAENGCQVFQGPERRLPIPDMKLEAADGLMLLDANFGMMVMHVLSMNPALIDDFDGMRLDPELDATRPENGWAPDGKSNFSEEFKLRFVKAQRERYYRLLAKAEERLALIQQGKGIFSDNEPFIIPDCIGINNSPKLFSSDMKYFAHTKGEYPVVHPDGSVTTELVKRIPLNECNPEFAGKMGASFQTTVKDFLWLSVELGEDFGYGEDGITGVDFESSMTCSSGNVKMISCPLLVMGHTAGYEYITAEWSYHNAKSADKSIAFCEGATHGWEPIDREKYGDTTATEAHYCAGWLKEKGRFF